MRIGVLLPTFETSAYPALTAAKEAELVGLHGVFVYDHLWQLGSDSNPSLSPFPVLGAVAATTERVAIGTLVARVGLLPDEILVDSFITLDRLSGGRAIAGIGTGDHKSRPEHDAFGLRYAPAAERRAALTRCAEALIDCGITTWIGGGAPETNAIAVTLRVPLNLWAVTPEVVASTAAVAHVTWGGLLPAGERGVDRLRALASAGAEWAVFAWGGACSELADAARAAEIALET